MVPPASLIGQSLTSFAFRFALAPPFVTGLTLHAFVTYIEYMKSMQLTIRKVPDRVDCRLRDRAREEGKSLNRVAIEALERGLGLSGEEIEHHDLDDLAGTWIEDPEFDRAIEDMDRVDPELWK